MKKRIVALLLCCVMLLTLSPSLIASASAEEELPAAATTEEPKTEEPKATEEPKVEEPKTTDQPVDPEQPATPEEPAAPEKPTVPEQPTTPEEPKVEEELPSQTSTFEPLNVVHTSDVAPFLPPVAGQSPMRARAFAATANTDPTEGIKLSKKAVPDGNGYKITMEAYTTGKVSTVTSSVPADIVLVLDVSGSMDEYIEVGSKDNTAQLDTVYGAAEGMYEYKYGYTTLTGWTDMRYQNGKWQYNGFGGWTDLEDSSWGTQEIRVSKLNALKISTQRFVDSVKTKADTDKVDHHIAVVSYASSATTVIGLSSVSTDSQNLKNAILNLKAGGSTAADYGMNQAKNILSGIDASRTSNRVVVMFTDGEPNYGNGFNTSVADATIATSKEIKASGATVYTVGVLEGADDTVPMPNDASNINRYMHYVSSNFKNASRMSNGGTATYPGDNKSYYLAAGNTAEMSNIFQTISENIQTSDIDLGTATIIKDTITPYFDVPANKADIKLYTASAKADGTFENRQPASGEVRATISGNAVSVTGFDFNANFVSKEKKSDGTYGQKLIIEFTVQPKASFLGGNNVPTNGTDSGIYSDGKLIKEFKVPTVDVEIPGFTVNAVDKNVYLLSSLTADQLKEGATAMVDGVNILKYTENDWQAHFVEIKPYVDYPYGNGVNDLTKDTDYTLTVAVTPKDESGSIVPKTDSATGNINVFKPEVTFKDSQITLGETADYANNKGTNFEVWKHEATNKKDTDVTMIGTAPTLNYSYDPAAAAFQQDTPVKVSTVTIGNTVVTSHVTFYREACSIKTNCNTTLAEVTDDVNFIVHVESLSLKITKRGASDLDKNQSFVFVVSNDRNDALKIENLEVVIHGNESVTLNGLPIGNYTVTEKTNWSWRYTPEKNDQSITLVAKEDNTVIFNNSRNKELWLTGGAWCDNNWATKTATKSN